MLKKIILLLMVSVIFVNLSYAVQTTKTQKTVSQKPVQKDIKVTFVELGSKNCIPCKMMQRVMDDIKKEYSDQVDIVFYDVWTKEGEPYAKEYGIRAIPTQVFLDKNGKEYFRHEGFFPKEEVVKVLKTGGVSANSTFTENSKLKIKEGTVCK